MKAEKFSVKPGDVADILERVMKRVDHNSKQPGELVMLALTVAECEVLWVKARWPYENDYEAMVSEYRKSARLIAVDIMERSQDSNVV